MLDDAPAQAFVAAFSSDGTGRVISGFPEPNQLAYARGQSQTLTVTPALLTATLNTGGAVVLQASNDITVNSPITVSAGGTGGALTLQAGRSIFINASITSDNGPLSLIANDRLVNGVVNAERDPGNAVISMAVGTSLNTGVGALTVELRDGAGKANASSGAITLQSVTAGGVNVTNSGTTAGSDVVVGQMTSTGAQTYANPNGTTVVAGNLSAASQITFLNSVALNAGQAVTAPAVNFAGTGTQTLSGPDGSLSNLVHNGSGTLRLTSAVTVTGAVSNTNPLATFDISNQTLTLGGDWSWTGGFFLSSGSDVNFNAAAGQSLTSHGQGFNHLTHSGAGTLTLRDSLTLTGNLTYLAGGLDATNRTMTVAGSWSWAAGAFTAAGSIVLFNGASPQVLASGGQSFNQVLHTGSGTLLLADALTVGGNFGNSAGTFDSNGQPVTVTGTITISGGVYIASSAAQIFNRDLTITGDATFLGLDGTVTVARNFSQSGGDMTAPSSSLFVGGAFVISDGSFDANGGTVTFNGSGGQSLNSGQQAFANLVHAGGGPLRLTGSDLLVTGTFTNSVGPFDANGLAVTVWGLTTIGNGTRYLGSTGSQYFGGGLSMPAGGSLDGSNLTLGGDVSAGEDGLSNPASITGNLSLDGASRVFTVAAGAGTVQLLVAAVLSGSPEVGLTKGGPGTLRLTAANTYTGPTTVQAGSLVVDGAQPTSSVNQSGGMLAGMGTVGSLTASSGTFSPGGLQTTGILTSTGSVGLASAVTFGVRLRGTTAGTNYDQLSVTGASNVNSDAGTGSTLAVSVGFPSVAGDTFTILRTTGGVSNTFQGLPEGATFVVAGMTFQITYVGNGGTDVVLTHIGGSEVPGGGGLPLARPPYALPAWAEGVAEPGLAARPSLPQADDCGPHGAMYNCSGADGRGDKTTGERHRLAVGDRDQIFTAVRDTLFADYAGLVL